MKPLGRLWLWVGFFLLVSPAGLFLSNFFDAGPAWGEWSPEALTVRTGYLPERLGQIARIWKAPLPDYAFSGPETKNAGSAAAAYILSGVLGVCAAAFPFILIGKRSRRRGNGGKTNRFIEKTLASAVSFLKDSVFFEKFAMKKGFLQNREPRIKLLAFMLFVCSSLCLTRAAHILALYALSLALAGASSIPAGYFLKRTLIFGPLFSLFIIAPALFNVFTPGDPLVTLSLGGLRLTVTVQGAETACRFVSRVLASVSFGALLSMSTPQAKLMRALRVFGIPSVFLLTIGMAHRYIFVMVSTIEQTFTAIKSRTSGKIRTAHGQNIITWNMASLWRRSLHMHSEVYSAMLSRGFSGEPKLAPAGERITVNDWLFLAFSAGIFMVSLRLFIRSYL